MLSISIISDIHHGLDSGSKKSSAAKELFEKFLSWHSQHGGEIVVDLGDKITTLSPERDVEFISEVSNWFKKITQPKFHLLGNMEVKHLSLEENSKIFDYKFGSKSIDLAGFHLVFWGANTKMRPNEETSLNEGDLEWLESDLAATDLPTIIFSHIPLSNGSFHSHYYFEKNFKHHACYTEESGIRIRETLSNSQKVFLCVNGHAHWNNYQQIDGIHFITVPALSDIFTTYPEPTSSWSKLVIDKEIQLQVFGNLPIEYRLPLPKLPIMKWLRP